MGIGTAICAARIRPRHIRRFSGSSVRVIHHAIPAPASAAVATSPAATAFRDGGPRLRLGQFVFGIRVRRPPLALVQGQLQHLSQVQRATIGRMLDL